MILEGNLKNSVGFLAIDDITFTPACEISDSDIILDTTTEKANRGMPERLCMNQGTCVLDENSFSCECSPGYSGERCEEHLDKTDDKKHGTSMNYLNQIYLQFNIYKLKNH